MTAPVFGFVGLELDELIAVNAAYQLAAAKTLSRAGGAYPGQVRDAAALWEIAVTVLGPVRAAQLARRMDRAVELAEATRPVGLG